jgi:hypothetical protein
VVFIFSFISFLAIGVKESLEIPHPQNFMPQFHVVEDLFSDGEFGIWGGYGEDNCIGQAYLKKIDGKKLPDIIAKEYRGIALCNKPGVGKKDFLTLYEGEFKTKVNELYLYYYMEWIKNVLAAIIGWVFMWIFILLSVFTAKWVLRGK